MYALKPNIFDDLDHLLKCTNKVFDITAVSETRITKQAHLITNINLKSYAIEFTPTESSAGGMLLHIASHLSYKPHPDYNICKANQLESIFVETINARKVILSLVVFTGIQIWMFLILKITIATKFFSKERKQLFLLGDCNTNLLNYNDHQPTNDFLDSVASNLFIPYIHLELLAIQKRSLTTYFPNVFLLK